MNTLNRTVLATLIGAALAGGLAVPQSAHARGGQDQVQSAQEREDAREAKRKEREAAAAARETARAEAAKTGATQSRAQAGRDQEQAQVRQREQAQQQREVQQRERELSSQRQQQERVREQNELTRERNQQAGRGDVERAREQAREKTREQAREESQRQRGPGERGAEREERAAAREQHQDARVGQADAREKQQQSRQERQQDRQDARHADLPPARRLDNRQRDQRIVREKQQAQVYQQAITTQIAPQAKAYAQTLQYQNRSYGSSYQQQYYWRLLQMLGSWGWQSYNYYNDPYYYTANDYRYSRGGSWYGINRYGADILRQAVNYGYQEGLYAGRADRQDRWRYDYQNAFVYRDANYGYRGYYVNQREYNHYFREGFRRGYDDGYRTRYQYGHSYNGSDVILGNVLSGILNLQAYRW